MALIITPDAVNAPGHCAASGTTRGPFIQTGRRGEPGRVQISVEWIKSVAAEIGLVPAQALTDALDDLVDAGAEIAMLRNRVERFTEDVGNVADSMVTFLQEVVAAANVAEREAIATLTARVAELESKEAA